MSDNKQLQIIVSQAYEYYHVTFPNKSEALLSDYLKAFQRALQVAGFTYVQAIEAVCGNDVTHSSEDYTL